MADTDKQRASAPRLRRIESGSGSDERPPKNLLGAGVELESIDPSHVSIDDIDPRERALVANAVATRRREFAAGRLCARRALRRLGIPDAPLLAGPDRVPRWPDGIVGSISHVADMCAAVVARASDAAGIGLDIEHALDLPADAWKVVLTEHERLALSAYAERERGLRARLGFSAKEAFYKCYRSAGGGWLDFSDVELRLTPDSDDIELRVSKLDESALRFDGRYALTPRFIYTAFTAR